MRESDPDYAQVASTDEIRVQDLYVGAYLLCCGFQLKDLTVISTNGKPVVIPLMGAHGGIAMLKFTMEKLIRCFPKSES